MTHTTPTHLAHTWHTDYHTTTLHCVPPRYTDYHTGTDATYVRIRQGRLTQYHTIPHITTTEGRVLRQRIDYQATPTLDIWISWASDAYWDVEHTDDARARLQRVMSGMPTDTDIVHLQEIAVRMGW